MGYSRSLLIYQEKPPYGLFFKLLILVVPAALFLTSLFLFSTGDSEGGLVLLIEVLFIGAIFLIVFPRKYQIYEDHLRVVLGGPFSVRVGFDRIKAVEVTRRSHITANFCTRLTGDFVHVIVHKGLSIAITPGDSGQFVENVRHALDEWSRIRATQS